MSKVRTNTPVHEIMTANPMVVDRHHKISDVARMFAENSFSHLPVVDGKKLIGIISYNDLLRVNYADAFDADVREVFAVLDNTKSIDDVMSRQPVTIHPRDTVRDAAKTLSEKSFHALPVVESKSGELLGIVTTTDIMRYLAEI